MVNNVLMLSIILKSFISLKDVFCMKKYFLFWNRKRLLYLKFQIDIQCRENEEAFYLFFLVLSALLLLLSEREASIDEGPFFKFARRVPRNYSTGSFRFSPLDETVLGNTEVFRDASFTYCTWHSRYDKLDCRYNPLYKGRRSEWKRVMEELDGE